MSSLNACSISVLGEPRVVPPQRGGVFVGQIGAQQIAALATPGPAQPVAAHSSRLVDGPRASALRFGDPQVQALLAALLAFRVLSDGFQNRDPRETVASLLGVSVDDYGRGRMTYDLRRLRLRGLIERIPFTRRYRVTDNGLRTAMCYHRTHAHELRPAMSVAFEGPPRWPHGSTAPSPRSTGKSRRG